MEDQSNGEIKGHKDDPPEVNNEALRQCKFNQTHNGDLFS